ncbi:hypothetical protein SPBR_08031 [Sporothrix brasiliensis 5110]|uniref:Uncharacterized protein n=1 Tax=Sporothrix brasiliensis 5110 TaxID=1398154 RepID=A0A0C2FCG6_9PEZI|nr:uncharacterized protein SPBR_08031 [Sporothrix brasiliensis 5110]KIH88813.1 hypothetical protein SPBR_08031 [Sporothrix brasiliensis 5110]
MSGSPVFHVKYNWCECEEHKDASYSYDQLFLDVVRGRQAKLNYETVDNVFHVYVNFHGPCADCEREAIETAKAEEAEKGSAAK